MIYDANSLKKHLHDEHKISPFSTYLKEIVYGGNDGIVTTFAVVAGFAGAQGGLTAGYTYMTVLLFGIANLLADGSSMGMGNFLSLRSAQDVYKSERAKEAREVEKNPAMEKAETQELLQMKGFTKEQAIQLVEIYSTNPRYWVDFMMDYELEIPNPQGENPFLTGLATFTSFITFGAIPLLPFILTQEVAPAFVYSCFFTFLALILLGILRWKVTKENILRSVGEIVLIGGISAVIAYLVGTFFRV